MIRKIVKYTLLVKKIQYFFVWPLVLALTAGFVFPKDKGNGVKTIVIDPGHGGKDPGCSGLSHSEKDVSLAVALRLGKLIEENLKDVKVIFTRTSDVFVELEDRAQIANKAKADLFISIHCNAAGKPVMITDPKTGKKRPKTYKNKKGKLVVVEKPNPLPFGTETYVMGLKNEEGKMKVATRENSAIFLEDDYEKKYAGFDPESEESYIIMSNYTTAYVIQSANLAMKLQEEYAKKSGRIDKGVHRQSIWVLWRTSMPSILTEIGYLTNPLEEQFLGSEKGQDYLAKSIFRGLRKYKDEIEGNKREYNDAIENQEPLENENILAGNYPGMKAAEDEEIQEEKKLEDKPLAVKTELKTPEAKPQKQGELKALPEKTEDSLTNKSTSTDSVVNAESIVDKFKKENSKPQVAGKKEVAPIDPPKQEIKTYNSEIVFKVQFASSEKELNLNQEKYSGITNSSTYKVNNVIKYTSGNYTSIKEAIVHQNKLREKGFKDCFVIAMKNEERIDVNLARKETGQ